MGQSEEGVDGPDPDPVASQMPMILVASRLAAAKGRQAVSATVLADASNGLVFPGKAPLAVGLTQFSG